MKLINCILQIKLYSIPDFLIFNFILFVIKIRVSTNFM